MMRTTVYSANVESAYVRVCSEEGNYDAHVGYNIIATSECRDGYVDWFVFTGPSGGCGAFVFRDESDAEAFAARVEEKGSIDPERYWDHVESKAVDALPDYVLNPHRPEYN